MIEIGRKVDYMPMSAIGSLPVRPLLAHGQLGNAVRKWVVSGHPL